jgi:hypothetical protein
VPKPAAVRSAMHERARLPFDVARRNVNTAEFQDSVNSAHLPPHNPLKAMLNEFIDGSSSLECTSARHGFGRRAQLCVKVE